jgi:hypothetical protein
MQTPGDCLRVDCGPDGSEMTFADPTDIDDANPCTDDVCNGTTPVHAPRTGTPCAQGFCDSAGRCVQCLDDSQCGGAPECKRAACVAGSCTIETAPPGTLCAAQTNQCDGNGNCVDCVNSGGCGECCVCLNFECIPA